MESVRVHSVLAGLRAEWLPSISEAQERIGRPTICHTRNSLPQLNVYSRIWMVASTVMVLRISCLSSTNVYKKMGITLKVVNFVFFSSLATKLLDCLSNKRRVKGIKKCSIGLLKKTQFLIPRSPNKWKWIFLPLVMWGVKRKWHQAPCMSPGTVSFYVLPSVRSLFFRCCGSYFCFSVT